jgi:hypothetical protein
MATATAERGRVFDGSSWNEVDDSSVPLVRGSQRPIPAVLDGGGKIHVSVVNFRGRS